MNKKGFTLVELAISISILSIVILFLIRIQVVVNNNKDKEVSLMLLRSNQSIISKYINDDCLENKGIKAISCDTKTKCDITFTSGKTRVVELRRASDEISYTILKYYDVDRTYISKKLPKGYAYNSINVSNTMYDDKLLSLIDISVSSSPEYDIQIVSKNQTE